MSWEETYRREYPCECDKGTYAVISETDDRDRTRSYRIIDCPECGENANIVAELRRKAKDEMDARFKELVEEIRAHFEKHYMEEWLSLFTSAKSKKAAWEVAKESGVESQSLTTFYKMYKFLSVDDYIRILASPYNMLKVIEALNIDDSPFKSKVEEAKKLSKLSYAVGFYC